MYTPINCKGEEKSINVQATFIKILKLFVDFLQNFYFVLLIWTDNILSSINLLKLIVKL